MALLTLVFGGLGLTLTVRRGALLAAKLRAIRQEGATA